MTGINHSTTATHGGKGTADDWNADHVIGDNVPFNHHQAEEFVIENRTDWPAGPVAGQIIHRTDLGNTFIWDGNEWNKLEGEDALILAWTGL